MLSVTIIRRGRGQQQPAPFGFEFENDALEKFLRDSQGLDDRLDLVSLTVLGTQFFVKPVGARAAPSAMPAPPFAEDFRSEGEHPKHAPLGTVRAGGPMEPLPPTMGAERSLGTQQPPKPEVLRTPLQPPKTPPQPPVPDSVKK